MDKSERIVITGIGVVSSAGIGKEAFWENLFAGKNVFSPVTLFDVSHFKATLAGEISDFDPSSFLGKKGLRDLDRSSKLFATATHLALQDSNLNPTPEMGQETGVSLGTTFGSVGSISRFDQESLIEGPRFVNPSLFPNTVISAAAGNAAIRYKIKAFNSTVSSGMCSAVDAIQLAVRSIRGGLAKRVIAGAVEEFCFQTYVGFYKLGYLSGLNGSQTISCPFDKRRNGIVFSEGATSIVLESLDSARDRNAPIYGEIKGWGSCFDPFRRIKYNPKGTGMKNAMKRALEASDLSTKDVDSVIANANSTQEADRIESLAIRDVFGASSDHLTVSGIKSILGETYSASGGMGIIAALGSFKRQRVPGTFHYEKKDPSCDLDYSVNQSKAKKVKNVMVNTFDINGSCSVLILSHPNGDLK